MLKLISVFQHRTRAIYESSYTLRLLSDNSRTDGQIFVKFDTVAAPLEASPSIYFLASTIGDTKPGTLKFVNWEDSPPPSRQYH